MAKKSANTPGLLLRLIAILAIYFGLKYYGGDVGRIILYPVTRLVTFLHEFGHAMGAVLTGGGVEGIQINNDGSGYTITRGGSKAIILMGGYIGSAILGNLLVFIGANFERWSSNTLKFLGFLMAFTGLFWFNSFYSTGILLLFGLSLWFIAQKTSFDREILMFLGLASLLYIIQDFRVGPSSDLSAYAETIPILPAMGWMYVWLSIVVVLSLINLKWIFGKK